MWKAIVLEVLALWGPNGLGDGSGKLGEQALGRRRSFNPVECSGMNQNGNNFDFALQVPGPVAKAEA